MVSLGGFACYWWVGCWPWRTSAGSECFLVLYRHVIDNMLIKLNELKWILLCPCTCSSTFAHSQRKQSLALGWVIPIFVCFLVNYFMLSEINWWGEENKTKKKHASVGAVVKLYCTDVVLIFYFWKGAAVRHVKSVSTPHSVTMFVPWQLLPFSCWSGWKGEMTFVCSWANSMMCQTKIN